MSFILQIKFFNSNSRFLKDTYEITNQLDSYLLSYDMEEGLIISNGSLNYHNGRFILSQNLTNILFFKELPEVLPPPSIQLRTPRPIEGASVTLDCRVLFQDFYSNLHLKWLLSPELLSSDRFIIGKQRKK
ncbi:Vascular endothelial growth factor receptor 1like, partial [Caligus rogercresseyi]